MTIVYYAVSYTHLDVYKRQVYSTILRTIEGKFLEWISVEVLQSYGFMEVLVYESEIGVTVKKIRAIEQAMVNKVFEMS